MLVDNITVTTICYFLDLPHAILVINNCVLGINVCTGYNYYWPTLAFLVYRPLYIANGRCVLKHVLV